MSARRILVAETHDNPEKLLLACRTLFQYGVDAVVSPANDASEELKKLGRIVFYGGEAVDGYPSVYSDIASGYAEAAAQFACEKRKNPALLLAENYEAYDTLRARIFFPCRPCRIRRKRNAGYSLRLRNR